jgi:OOP family OmpA-OmpF porin
MNTNFLKSASLLSGLLFSTGLMAQDATSTAEMAPFPPAGSFRTWSIGISGGATTPQLFIGKNDFTNPKTQIGYGAYIKKQVLPSLGFRADFFKGKLEGNNANTLGNGTPPSRPVYAFQTDIKWSGALGAELTLANINWLIKKTTVQPYLSASAGLVGYRPRIATSATGAFNNYKTTDNGNIHELIIPIGTGLKFNLSDMVNLDLGYTMNFIDGDNVDGAYFGTNSDRFAYGHIGLEFSLGDKSKPQLATYNPVAAMNYDYIAKNKAVQDNVNSQLAAQKAADDAKLAALQSDLDKMKADADGDGVADYFDKCPGTPSGTKVDGSGCPLPVPVVQQPDTKIYITEADRKVVSEAIRNLEFDFGKATIRAKSFPSLNRVAALLVQKNFSLKLAGHTDDVGSDAANMKLSKDRAESVKNYLVGQGANASRVEAIGYGESQPIATNKTAAGRQQNRRVEFTLY